MINAFWTENLIEIYFHYDKIDYNYINKSQYKFEFLINLFRQISHHEFAHTISIKSTFDCLPIEIRNLLVNENISNIEKSEVFNKSEYCLMKESLQKINFDLIGRIFRDFYADFLVFHKIDKSVPSESLKIDYSEILDYLKSESILNPNFRTGFIYTVQPKKFKNIFIILLLSRKFFIFHKWDLLISIFKKYKLYNFLKFLYLINLIFQTIIENNQNYDSMNYDLIQLAKLLDFIDYEDSILKNKYPQKKIIDKLKMEFNLKRRYNEINL